MQETNGRSDILLDRQQFNKILKSIKEKQSIDFNYKSTGSLEEELDDFFGYVESKNLLQRLVSLEYHPPAKGPDISQWIDQRLEHLELHQEQRIVAVEQLLAFSLALRSDPPSQKDALVKHNQILFQQNVFHAVFLALARICNQLYFESQKQPSASHDNSLLEISRMLTLCYLVLEVNRFEGRFANVDSQLDLYYLEYLLGMLTRLKEGHMQSFPVKKLLLLVWKVLLCTLGDDEQCKRWKPEARLKFGLPPQPQGVVKCNYHDVHLFQNELFSRYPTYEAPADIPKNITFDPLVFRVSPSLHMAMGVLQASQQVTLPYQSLFPPKQVRASNNNNERLPSAMDDNASQASTVVLPFTPEGPCLPNALIEANSVYLQNTRLSLSDYQILQERQRAVNKWKLRLENQFRSPSSDSSSSTQGTAASDSAYHDTSHNANTDIAIFTKLEQLYEKLVPDLQGLVVVLLKTMLSTASPRTKNNKDTEPSMEEADVDRHREVLCKSVSAILLLLLKWFKLSHVLKFEYLSQLLVDSGCMLLILKIFGLQEVSALATTKSNVDGFGILDQIRKLSQVTNGTPPPPKLPASDAPSITDYVNHRNMFWIINLLRTLQLLTKHKTHRIMLLVQYKSAAILKRVHKIAHPTVEIYALKNLKNQIPFLGRKWRTGNMKLISAIYFVSTPDLRDDWLLARNDKDSDLEDGKMEEINLRLLIRLYHGQTYLPQQLPADDSIFMTTTNGTNEINGLVNDLGAAKLSLHDDLLAGFDDLDTDFKENYQTWLDHEVYSQPEDDYDSASTNADQQQLDAIDGWIATPVPGSPVQSPSASRRSSIDTFTLTEDINRLYQEELHREFHAKVAGDGWDTPAVPVTPAGDILEEEETAIHLNPLSNIDWTNMSEQELTERLRVVEEKTMRRWMNVDLDDPSYHKVISPVCEDSTAWDT
ncbi:hypothetical protein DM01DRAFT_1309695 [Hesseltinella vesiculosa]|uniref:N1221-domain-containing protein n=1 Tax=Hesseltinella vesiculosa TaxID=101127 RepID=A0A1X2G943_9FUNG|nr:hypothetical protein DM01DRAFT_1309695 [Hesseltinella vesiculosa]